MIVRKLDRVQAAQNNPLISYNFQLDTHFSQLS